MHIFAMGNNKKRIILFINQSLGIEVRKFERGKK